MKTIINDTADVVFKRKSDGAIIFTAEAQLASISQSVQEEKIKGGIGNKTIAVIRSEKELELTVRNAVFDRAWLEIAEGVEFANGSVTIYKKESLPIVSGAVTLAVAPVGATIHVEDDEGTVLASVVDGTDPKKFTLTGGTNGENVTVLYRATATGDTLEIRSDTFSEAYEVEYHTVEYSPSTNKIVKDLYFQFDSVTPSDNFELSFESGAAITPELKFTAKNPLGSDVIGRMIEVPRAVA